MRLLADAAQAGLIAGTVPTKGSMNRSRSAGSTIVDAVLQAMTAMSGWCLSISAPTTASTRGISLLSSIGP